MSDCRFCSQSLAHSPRSPVLWLLTVIITNGSNCKMSPMPPSEKMSSVFDLLKDHANILEYHGIENHRGIECARTSLSGH